MLVYLDNCCYNRPFDDLRQDRVYLEAEAVLSIISNCEKGKWTLMSSGAIEFEMSQIPDFERFEKVQNLYSAARYRAISSKSAENLAISLQKYGIKPLDNMHLALAQTNGADVFLTTDDKFLKNANRLKQICGLTIKITNPILFFMEGARK